MADKPEEHWVEKIRELVSKYDLGYYFNPGGVEFFHSGTNLKSCQLPEFIEEQDYLKLLKWTEDNKEVLLGPKPQSYIWTSEGICELRTSKY